MRLRIVKGLSSELFIAIIIRGISDPQIPAIATNAKLSLDSIVEFLSSFAKASNNFKKVYSNSDRTYKFFNNNNSNRKPLKRQYDSKDSKSIKCFQCNQYGQRIVNCNKCSNSISNNSDEKTITLLISRNDVLKCTFCKKVDHTEGTCFAKERANSRNNNAVNFCHEIAGSYKNRDVTIAVILRIPHVFH